MIQKSKELGGLGVGSLVVKNVALLFKWWWQFLDNSYPFWKNIISSNHGVILKTNVLNSRNVVTNSYLGQILDIKNGE